MEKKKEAEQERSNLLIGILVVFGIIAIIGGLIFFLNSRTKTEEPKVESEKSVNAVELVEKLNKKGVKFYYSETCPHCHEQIEILGEGFDQLKNKINCQKQPKQCQVQYVPTWEWNGKQEVGVKSLKELWQIAQ